MSALLQSHSLTKATLLEKWLLLAPPAQSVGGHFMGAWEHTSLNRVKFIPAIHKMSSSKDVLIQFQVPKVVVSDVGQGHSIAFIVMFLSGQITEPLCSHCNVQDNVLSSNPSLQIVAALSGYVRDRRRLRTSECLQTCHSFIMSGEHAMLCI